MAVNRRFSDSVRAFWLARVRQSGIITDEDRSRIRRRAWDGPAWSATEAFPLLTEEANRGESQNHCEKDDREDGDEGCQTSHRPTPASRRQT